MNTPIYQRLLSLSKGKLTTIVAILLLFIAHAATAYEADKAPENVQKKAVIIKHNAMLFGNAFGYYGRQAPFMQIYFLMTPANGNRVPVSIRPYKTGTPDGWLDRNSFVEWNTLQMIKLEAQSGRKLAKIFQNRHCAELFGKYGREYSGCQVLGEELNRFTSDTNLQMLIPVFEKSWKSYQGGFIRVYQEGSAVRAAPTFQRQLPYLQQGSQGRSLGYDIVFVIDSTSTSMGSSHFVHIKDALQGFITHIQQSIINGKVKDMPIRIGVLFYRGRADSSTCNLGYLTKWGQHLTGNLQRVVGVLASEKEATCHNSVAVLDALNRVLYETPWEDNHFKSIILVGKTPPPPVSDNRNPMRLSVSYITQVAKKKNIRILAFKLGEDDESFKKLALETVATNQGRYKNLLQMDNTEMFKRDLFQAMIDEWRLLSIAQGMISNRGNPWGKYNLTQYEALIIRARLPNTTPAYQQRVPEFVKGWIPDEIQNQLVVGEFIFMDRFHLAKLVNTLGDIAEAALMGHQDGGVAFISSIREVLAAQTRIPSSQLFKSGESLNGTLQKANILPFRTDILTFTAQEVNTWKPADYKRINMILKDKVKMLGEFMGNPKNIHYFGNTPHLYVPRVFFP